MLGFKNYLSSKLFNKWFLYLNYFFEKIKFSVRYEQMGRFLILFRIEQQKIW